MISHFLKRQMLLVNSPVYRNCQPSHENTALPYRHDHPMASAPTTVSVTYIEYPATIMNSPIPFTKTPRYHHCRLSPLQFGPVQTAGSSSSYFITQTSEAYIRSVLKTITTPTVRSPPYLNC
jgi:hypothetical protein